MAELRQIAVDGRRIADAVKSVEEKTIYTAGENVTITNGVISASGGTGGITALYRHCITIGAGIHNFTFAILSTDNTAFTTVTSYMNYIDESAYAGSGHLSGEDYRGVLTEIQKLSSSVLRVSGLRYTVATGEMDTYTANLLDASSIFFHDYVTEIT